jgi:hypothetical protein
MINFIKSCAEKDTLTAEDREKLIEIAEKFADGRMVEFIKCKECGKNFKLYPNALDKYVCPYCWTNNQTQSEQALKKQIPIKPKKSDEKHHTSYCPICECEFYQISEYCSNCGQKLDWSGDDE